MAFVVSVGRVGCRRRGLVMTGGEGLPPPTSPFAAGGKVSPFGVGAEGSLASSKAMKVDVATEKNKALIDWLRVHGVYMEDRSTWGKAPHALVVTNESTDEGEPCGRGLLAKRDINQGESTRAMLFLSPSLRRRDCSGTMAGERTTPQYEHFFVAQGNLSLKFLRNCV